MFGLSRRERMLSHMQSMLEDWSPGGSWFKRAMSGVQQAWNGAEWPGTKQLYRRSGFDDFTDAVASRLKDSFSDVQRASSGLMDMGRRANSARWPADTGRFRVFAVAAGIGRLAYLAARKS